MSDMSLSEALARAQTLIGERVEAAIGPADTPIAEAMRYASRGGKGLRGFLVMEGARLHRIGGEVSMTPAAAIECLHAYSLIHDDLPCMDDDDLRRGLPTVHRKWDEATAVLAGDALQSLAFELLAQTDAASGQVVVLIRTLAEAAGLRGMVGGQALDIAAESAPERLSLAEIETLQAGKTGALITWAACAGPHMAGASPEALARYGDCLGRAFQIWDDVLDVEGDAATVGKAVGKDADAGKATFVSLLGLDEAKGRAGNLVTEACDSLSGYGEDAETLRELARYVITRDR